MIRRAALAVTWTSGAAPGGGWDLTVEVATPAVEAGPASLPPQVRHSFRLDRCIPRRRLIDILRGAV